MDAKSNEIAAVRDPLRAFTDLARAVITIDALHTQAEQAVTSVKELPATWPGSSR